MKNDNTSTSPWVRLTSECEAEVRQQDLTPSDGFVGAYQGHGRARQSERRACLAHWSAALAVFQRVLEQGSLLGTQPCREKDQKSLFGLKDVPLEPETWVLRAGSVMSHRRLKKIHA